MPLTRIDIPAGKPPEYGRAVLDTVYETLHAVAAVPEADRFQILTEHDAAHLDISPDYLGIARSAAAIVIQITLNEGRSVEVKRELYRALAESLHERVGIRPEDVTINLVEVKKENWSFGNGEAPYA